MLRSLAGDVFDLDQRAMRSLMPVLQEARKELRRDMLKWLKDTPEGDARFTAQEYRRALISVERSMEAIGQIRPELRSMLGETGAKAGVLAVGHLEFEVARMAQVFGGPGNMAMMPTQIDTAAVMAVGRKELIPRFRTSAARYSKGVRDDLRRQFGVGLARGETFTQLTNRLRRLGGPKGLVALRGVAGERGALVEQISEGLFRRYRHWAERLVRTETIHAYNTQHHTAIEFLNEDLDEDEVPFQKRWDATIDRVCPICRALDGQVVAVDAEFRGPSGQTYKHAPAHPNGRCTVLAWHPSWGDVKGEKPRKTPGTAQPKPPRAKREASGAELRKKAAAAKAAAVEKGRRQIAERRAAEAKARQERIAELHRKTEAANLRAAEARRKRMELLGRKVEKLPRTPPENEGFTGKQLRVGKVVETSPLGGGANESRLAVVKAPGMGQVDAVWKPKEDEEPRLRRNVKAGSYYLREAAASNVAQHMGVGDLVPKTVAREGILVDGKKQSGSLQALARTGGNSTQVSLADIERARAFDFVTGNSDRHGGNMLYRPTAKGSAPVLIDNGLSFPAGPPTRFIQPGGIMDRMFDFKGSQRKPRKATRDLIVGIDEGAVARDLFRSGIDRRSIESTVRRIRHLKRDPSIIGYNRKDSDRKAFGRWEQAAEGAENVEDPDVSKIVSSALRKARKLGRFPR